MKRKILRVLFALVLVFGIGLVIAPTSPGELEVSNLIIQPAEVQPNETVTITVTVYNGGYDGDYYVVLKINGVEEATETLENFAGDKDITFKVTREEPGSYSVTVAGLSGSFTVVGPSPTITPAEFSVSNLGIQPAEVQPNETVTITVTVANTGGSEGSYTVVLKINGVEEAEKGVTVAAGSSQDVTFSVTREEPGSYSVTVAGLSGSFTVVGPSPTPSINWAIVAGIIAAVVAVGLLTFFLIRRRAT